jgi:hypothetical protein
MFVITKFIIAFIHTFFARELIRFVCGINWRNVGRFRFHVCNNILIYFYLVLSNSFNKVLSDKIEFVNMILEYITLNYGLFN